MSDDNDLQEKERAACTIRSKTWTGLGTVMLAGAALSLLPHASHAGVLGKLTKPGAAGAALVQIAGSEGGEGGEGGEGAAGPDLGVDDVAYLTQLGLVRGHLDVVVDLYRAGERQAALSHMKHPGDELYAALVPAFAKRGAPGFGEPLERLARLVEDGAPVAEVDAAYRDVRAGIVAAEAGVPEASRADLAQRFQVIVNLIRTAAEEYDMALEDGRVVNAHEYQDALGFVRTAQALLDAMPVANAAAAEAVAEAHAQLDKISALWPSLVPPAAVGAGDPSKLFGAAAYIEIAGLDLK